MPLLVFINMENKKRDLDIPDINIVNKSKILNFSTKLSIDYHFYDGLYNRNIKCKFTFPIEMIFGVKQIRFENLSYT